MLIIGKGTDPKLNNEVTIAFDKKVLEGLEKNRPAGGYPAAQEKGIQEIRDRIANYEAQHGTVDVAAVEAKQDAQRAAGLAMLTGLAASMGFPVSAGGFDALAAEDEEAEREMAKAAMLAGGTLPVTLAPPGFVPKTILKPTASKPATAGRTIDRGKVYLVRLSEGDGDTYVKLVSGDTYNWIVNGGKFPKSQISAYVDGKSGHDLTRAQDDLIQIDKDLPTMDEQDRANTVMPDFFNGARLDGYSVTTLKVVGFCAQHGLTLGDEEYEGLAL